MRRSDTHRAGKQTVKPLLGLLLLLVIIYPALETLQFPPYLKLKCNLTCIYIFVYLPNNALIRIIIVAKTIALRCTRVNFIRE